MFANEDFDIDEDFLDDISQKETEYYSQRLSSDEENGMKKRFRNDEDNLRQSSSEEILDFGKSKYAVCENNFLVPCDGVTSKNKSVRKNLILERLNRHTTNDTNFAINQQNLNTVKCNSIENTVSKSTINESRKNLISERFKKSNVNSAEKNSHQVVENDQKSKDCVAAMGSMAKPAKLLCHKPVTVVRQFPGPAGLLPDLSNGIASPLIPESVCLDDSDDRSDADSIDNSSIISKFCSQNTTNAFTEGAWQLLMSDLSPDFLNGHEISTIKQKVLTNSYRNNKVPFLAGIVQRVDFSFPDPLVVLRDCTGTIEGTVCKDILLEYSHSLDIGVVLFLGNVGLLTVGNHLKKCHVIITLKNILNIYTVKSQIFNVSEMEVRLKNLNNRTNSPISNIQNRINFERMKTKENTNPQPPGNNSMNGSNVHSISMAAEISNKCANVVRDISKNLNSFQADNVSNKPAFESGGIEDLDDEFAASFFDIDDNLVSKPETDFITERNSPPPTDMVNPVENPSTNVEDLNTKSSSHKESEAIKKKSPVKEENSVSKTSDIRLKLSVFKSNAELTPPDSAESSSKKIVEDKSNDRGESSKSNFLFNDENDSDEELFSQLDVESIVSCYNNKLNDVN